MFFSLICSLSFYRSSGHEFTQHRLCSFLKKLGFLSKLVWCYSSQLQLSTPIRLFFVQSRQECLFEFLFTLCKFFGKPKYFYFWLYWFLNLLFHLWQDRSQILKVNGWLLLEWFDGRLKWTSNDTKSESLVLTKKNIWTPEIFLFERYKSSK